MLPVVDEIVCVLCIMILAVFSFPAILVAWLLVSIFDPAFKHQTGFYLSFVGGVAGLMLTEVVIQFLSRTKADRPLILWFPKSWASYIRVAQFTGVACVLIVRFVMP
jgi:hypothetical protein